MKFKVFGTFSCQYTGCGANSLPQLSVSHTFNTSHKFKQNSHNLDWITFSHSFLQPIIIYLVALFSAPGCNGKQPRQGFCSHKTCEQTKNKDIKKITTNVISYKTTECWDRTRWGRSTFIPALEASKGQLAFCEYDTLADFKSWDRAKKKKKWRSRRKHF